MEPMEQGEQQAPVGRAAEGNTPAAGEESSMRALVEFMARGLSEHPEEVSVTPVEGKASVIFELRVASSDMGKIIGKDGRVAKAMRTLLKVAATKERKRAILEIV
jgi:predicted RNA-binding protein YlqC (UPF0109 family)